MKARILYLSCHSIHEFEDCKLFTELGHEIVSQGAYRFPYNPVDNSRPPIPEMYYNEELSKLATAHWGDEVDKPLIDWCETVYILGVTQWLESNWSQIKHKTVIWRSNGQTTSGTESYIAKLRREGLKIVRWSPFERRIPGYAGEDAMIRAYKDPDEWKGWTGEKEQVITVAQAMKKREDACKFSLFEKCTRGFPRKLYGHTNQDVGELWGGELDYEELKQVYRENRIFFYTCTRPAQYTMAWQEAMMTGIPTVCIGPTLAEYNIEVPHLIENGVNGFTSDSLVELRRYVSMLLNDYDLAKRISRGGRKRAIELFGREKIKKQWQDFFDSLKVK